MTSFERHSGIAAVLPADNVDTDVIIPIQPLLELPKARLGSMVFAPLRYDGAGEEIPGFVLNRPRFRGASILVAGRNFGCGSSREGAVHALHGFGIRVVVAPSFGDIFHGNCFKNGVLPIALPESDHARLVAEAERVDGTQPFEVDLAGQTIACPGGVAIPFDVDPDLKALLLEGQDEVVRTLAHEDEIAAFQARDRASRPWVWLRAAGAR